MKKNTILAIGVVAALAFVDSSTRAPSVSFLFANGGKVDHLASINDHAASFSDLSEEDLATRQKVYELMYTEEWRQKVNEKDKGPAVQRFLAEEEEKLKSLNEDRRKALEESEEYFRKYPQERKRIQDDVKFWIKMQSNRSPSFVPTEKDMQKFKEMAEKNEKRGPRFWMEKDRELRNRKKDDSNAKARTMLTRFKRNAAEKATGVKRKAIEGAGAIKEKVRKLF